MKVHTKEGAVSHITSYPPILSLSAIVFGLLLDRVFSYRLDFAFAETLGVIFVALAPLLIFWAQRSNWLVFKTKKIEDVSSPDFHQGPYHFIRHPTYLGLFCLVLGFAFLAHSISILVFNIIAFFIVNVYIIPHEEKILETKYGEKYLLYKKEVKI
jgi:protein-S-isoprenylcysteine O-methyltransferase Ste14